MLQSIRDHTQGWIAGIIVSLLILSFALWGIHSYFVEGSNSSVVAKVNGSEITKNQLAVAYERMRRQLQIQYSSNYQLPQQEEAGLKERALKALINVQLLKQASLAENYRISESQINNYLENMPEFQVNGQFSPQRFQQILETTLFNIHDFFDLIHTNLLIEQPRLGMIFTSFSLPNEIAKNMELVNQERHVQYLILPFASINKESLQLPTDKIIAFYKTHEDEFKTPEQVSIEYLELSLKDIIPSIQVSDDILKKYYTENTSSFSQPMQWKLDSIFIPLSSQAKDAELQQAQLKAGEALQQIAAGKDLTTVAKALNVQRNELNQGNWISLNQVPSELQKTVLSLEKSGQIAKPVRTNTGVYILKANLIKDPVVQSFEQSKNQVRELFIRQQSEEKFAELREKLSNLTYEHPESLDAASKALNIPIKTSELFSKEKGGKGIISNNKVREAAFSNEVINLKNNSDLIQLTSENVIVIRLKNHTPASLLPLKSVENQIITLLKNLEVETQAKKLIEEIKQKLEKNVSPAIIANEYKLRWNDAGYIGRHSNKIDSAILESAFSIPKSNNLHSYSVTKIQDGYALVALLGVRNGSNNQPEQYKIFAEQIQNVQGLMEYELYKQSIQKKAKIVLG